MEKISFIYKKPYSLNEYGIESIWATAIEGFYRIENIPFFIYNIALGDIVSVEDDDGELLFDEIIAHSGHSTVQIIILNGEPTTDISSEFEILGCHWEENKLFNMVSLDIGGDVAYSPIKNLLDAGQNSGRWSYKEACLEHEY